MLLVTRWGIYISAALAAALSGWLGYSQERDAEVKAVRNSTHVPPPGRP